MTFTFEFAVATFSVSPLPNAYICDFYSKLWKGYKVLLRYFSPATEKNPIKPSGNRLTPCPMIQHIQTRNFKAIVIILGVLMKTVFLGKIIKLTTFTVSNVKHIALKFCTLLLTLRLVTIGKSCLLFTIFLEIIHKCFLVPLTYFSI